MSNEYLLKATLRQYESLKKQESEIVSDAIKFSNMKSRNEAIKATFKYNPGRFLIGIYVGENLEKLAIDDENLSSEEMDLVRRVHQNLEARLGKLKLRDEEWI
jgi:hypothetical protein